MVLLQHYQLNRNNDAAVYKGVALNTKHLRKPEMCI